MILDVCLFGNLYPVTNIINLIIHLPKVVTAYMNTSNGYLEFKTSTSNDLNKLNFLWLGEIQENLNKRLYVDIVHYTAFFNDLIKQKNFRSSELKYDP